MSVDDVRIGIAGKPELFEDPDRKVLMLGELEVRVLVLLVRRLVVDEVALERRHLVLAEERRIGAAPHVPEEVEPLLAFGRAPLGEKALAHQRVRLVEQRFARVFFAVDRDGRECAVRVCGHAAVEQEVAVAHEIHAAVREQELRMLADLAGVIERRAQLVHEVLLLLGQHIRIGGQHGREPLVGKLVLDAVDDHRSALIVHAVQHAAMLHVIVGVLFDDLPLQLEQDDRHRLVHLGDHLGIVVVRVADLAREELRAGIVAVCFERELQKRRERNAVAVLDRVDVAVFQRIDDCGRDERAVARGGAHPQDVVIAPLDIHIMIGKQPVHDDVRAGAAVEHVADDVQPVDDEPLDEVT